MSGRRPVACSMQAQMDRAVDQYRRLVGGAYPVGVGSDVGHALRHPPCGAAQAVILQRHVERRDHHVRHVVRRIRGRFETCCLEFRDHARRAEQEKPFGRRVVLADVVDRRKGGGVHFLACGVYAQHVELVQVVGDRLRRIVGQERIADAHLLEPREERLGVGKERHAHVDRAVHVECHVPDAAQAFHQLVVRVDRAVFFECSHLFTCG